MISRAWAPGDVLAQKFRLIEPLGQGGMGVVWRAEHLTLRSAIAVKLVHETIMHSEGAAERFLREAQAAAALRSPHVVQVLDFGIDGGTPYIVMELLEGESLAARLKRFGRLSFDETTTIVTQVARALHKAHEAGVVHRDLKPDNVFLTRNLDELLVKVLDFGIAKTIAAEGGLTHTGAVLGSPHYMSPEQARGRSDVDHRSDLWSLGVITFECLTGTRPFESEVLGDLLIKICTDPIPAASGVAPVPAGFDAWVLRVLDRDPNRRFASALELAQTLKALAPTSSVVESRALSFPPSAPIQAAPVALPPPPAPSRSSGLIWIAAAIVVLGGGIVLTAIFVVIYLNDPSVDPASSVASSQAPAPSTSIGAAPPSASAVSPVPTTPRVATTGKTSTTTTTTATTGSGGGTSSGSDSCKRACAKVSACGEKCNFGGPCVGIAKVMADCVNSKKNCVEMARCFD